MLAKRKNTFVFFSQAPILLPVQISLVRFEYIDKGLVLNRFDMYSMEYNS